MAPRDVSHAVDRPRGAPGHLGCRLYVRAEERGRRRYLRAMRDQYQLGLSIPGRGARAACRGHVAAPARESAIAGRARWAERRVAVTSAVLVVRKDLTARVVRPQGAFLLASRFPELALR